MGCRRKGGPREPRETRMSSLLAVVGRGLLLGGGVAGRRRALWQPQPPQQRRRQKPLAPPCSHPGHPRRHPHIQVACQAERTIREQRVRRCVAHAVCPNAQLLENEATSETAQSRCRCRGRSPSTPQPSMPLPSSPVSQKWGSATIHKGRAILMNICNFVLNCKV